MQHKAMPFIQRPASAQAYAPFRRHGADLKLLKKFIQSRTRQAAIHHKPHRSSFSRMSA